MDEPTSSAGLDWAKDEHALCVLEEASGRVLLERRFAHEEGGIEKLCRSLVQMGVERVAVERPEGVLVERVLEAGIAVIPVHPNQLKVSRPRFRPRGIAPSQTPSTPSALQSSPAPTTTASARWCLIRTRPRR